jgi:ribonuclease MRP protein subunit RMP1
MQKQKAKEKQKRAPKLPPRNELELLNRAINFIYHRNKNQHHRSHWWKHLTIFRRQLRAITAHVLTKAPPPSDELLSPLVVLHAKGEERLQTWVQFYVVQWYRAFSQVLTERRFVGIGLLLLTILAKACAILGATQALKEHGHRDIVEAMEGIEQTEAEKQLFGILQQQLEVEDAEDFGEVVERVSLSDLAGPEEEEDDFVFVDGPEADVMSINTNTVGESLGDTKTLGESVSVGKPSRKPKKRKTNPIDDLFDVLS